MVRFVGGDRALAGADGDVAAGAGIDGACDAADVGDAGAQILAGGKRDVALRLDAAASFGVIAAAQVVAPVPGQVETVSDVDGGQFQVAPGVQAQAAVALQLRAGQPDAAPGAGLQQLAGIERGDAVDADGGADAVKLRGREFDLDGPAFRIA